MGRRRKTSHVYKRKDSPVWWCWYYDSAGRLRRQSTKCATRGGAEAALVDLERRARDPSYAASHSTTLERAIGELIKHRRDVTQRAAGTVSMYETKGGHLVRILGADTPLGAIGAKEVDGFIGARLEEGAARTTVSKELTTLRATLKLARRRGEFPRDPAEVIPAFAAEYKPRERFLTFAEAEALLAELLPDRAARVAYILASGCRWSESDRAERGDAGREAIHVRGTKTRESLREVPVLPSSIVPMASLLDHAAEHAEGVATLFRRWTNVRRDLAAACARAGIPSCTPNDLRRTLATWVRSKGVSPTLIGSLLGHKDGRMVERVYGRLPPEQLRAAIVGQVTPQREARVSKRSASAGKMGSEGTVKRSKKARNAVPRDGIEPPTRGFSIPTPKGQKAEKRRGLRRVA